MSIEACGEDCADCGDDEHEDDDDVLQVGVWVLAGDAGGHVEYSVTEPQRESCHLGDRLVAGEMT